MCRTAGDMALLNLICVAAGDCGSELALLLFLKGQRIGVEIKRSDAPTMTSSMVSAVKDLELHRLLVIYPGATRYSLHSKVEVMSLAQSVVELG